MTEPSRPRPYAQPPASAEPVEPAVDFQPLPPALLGLAYLLFAVAGVLAAVLCVLLIPFRIGSTLAPIAPVLAILAGVLLPGVARGLTDSMMSALPPAIGQVLGTLVLSTSRPEGDVLMPAGSTTAVSYAVLLLGLVTPLFMVGLATRRGPWTWRTIRQGALAPGRHRPVEPARSAGSGSDSGGVR